MSDVDENTEASNASDVEHPQMELPSNAINLGPGSYPSSTQHRITLCPISYLRLSKTLYKVSSLRVQPNLRLLLKFYFCDFDY